MLTPMHRGEAGTLLLNSALQDRLNPKEVGIDEIPRGSVVFRVGDKVMQIRNNYDKEIFNGDMGIIESVNKKEASVVIRLFDGRPINYEKSELDQIIHAFAISVHKSQGSEYSAIVIPLLTQHFMMLQRTLLYTGITRGKRLVIVVGTKRAVRMAVENKSSNSRFTWLHERLRLAGAMENV